MRSDREKHFPLVPLGGAWSETLPGRAVAETSKNCHACWSRAEAEMPCGTRAMSAGNFVPAVAIMRSRSLPEHQWNPAEITMPAEQDQILPGKLVAGGRAPGSSE